MKHFVKYFLIIFVIALIAGLVYWQKNKKHIVKTSIAKAITKNSDSLYYIHYDSSKIDAINGNVAFYNVSLQSDSAQKQMLDSVNDLPDALFIIKVKEVKATGINVAGLLQKENVALRKLILHKPSIQIIQTGMDSTGSFTHDDTLALYKKILGRFNSITADTIEVQEGNVLISNRMGKPLATFENINIVLNKFVVDDAHDYQNVISYFINNVWASVENIQLPESKNKKRINIEKLLYDAGNRVLQAKNIRQYRSGNSQPLIDLKNIHVDGLNTNAFILDQQLVAGIIKCDGGLITVYKDNKQEKKGNKIIQFSSELIDQAKIRGIDLGNTKFVVIDQGNPDKAPFIINEVKFIVPESLKVTEGNTLNHILAEAGWQLYVGGFSLFTKDKLYKIDIDNIQLDNKKGNGRIGNISVKHILSTDEMVRQNIHQKDIFDLEFTKIEMQGIDFKELISNNKLEVNMMTLQPVLKIYNDRTLPPDTSSKVGKYPQQLIQDVETPLYIKKINIKNGLIAYTERSKLSALPGTVSFTNVNAAIDNVTNISERIQSNATCKLTIQALFQGTAKLSTEWKLPLAKTNAEFSIRGAVGSFHAAALNNLIEPLALVSIKKGEVNGVTFNITGDDHNAKGNSVVLYSDLKMELLKKTNTDEIKTRNVVSFIANMFVKNDNPQKGTTRKGPIDQHRDIQRSFFNLLWKSIFNGINKTVK